MTQSANEPDIPDRDGMLGVLVSMVNGSGLEISITLAVPGGPIQGTLIGHDRWLELLDERVAAANADLAGLFNAFRDPGGDADAEDSEKTQDDENAEGDPPEPRHIHMQDARYVYENGFTPGFDHPGLLWRGRLAEVAGWSLGWFHPEE